MRHVLRSSKQQMYAQEKDLGAPMVSADEKRALILAHHASRTSRRRKMPVAAYYIGVTASCLIVVSGWWVTWGAGISSGLRQQPDEAFQIIKDGYQQAKETMPALNAKSDVKTLLEQAKNATAETDAQRAALLKIADQISHSTSTNQ
ncbi:MAG: hypothetical protein Q7R83_03435 [bacterium]|nr:hypothetical protein [bacterium]